MSCLIREYSFIWEPQAIQTVTVGFRVGSLGHRVSVDLQRDCRLETVIKSNQLCLRDGALTKTLGHQDLGELPRLAILHVYCHTSILGE